MEKASSKPGEGRKSAAGSSALMRTSIACPDGRTSAWVSVRRSRAVGALALPLEAHPDRAAFEHVFAFEDALVAMKAADDRRVQAARGRVDAPFGKQHRAFVRIHRTVREHQFEFGPARGRAVASRFGEPPGQLEVLVFGQRKAHTHRVDVGNGVENYRIRRLAHEVAKAIACQLYHEHPKSAAYVTHRGKTWHYAGEWSAALTPNTARTVA